MMSAMPTSEAIKTDAKTYNAEYPEATPEIEAGTPELLLTAFSTGTGWRVTTTACWGVRTADGGFIAACEPVARIGRRLRSTETLDSAARGLHRELVKLAKIADINVKVVTR